MPSPFPPPALKILKKMSQKHQRHYKAFDLFGFGSFSFMTGCHSAAQYCHVLHSDPCKEIVMKVNNDLMSLAVSVAAIIEGGRCLWTYLNLYVM